MDVSIKRVICGIGCPILDIAAIVDEKFFKKHKIKEDSGEKITYEQLKIILKDLKKESKSIKFLAGGSTQNTMRGIQYLFKKNIKIENLKKKTVFFGSIGSEKDKFIEDNKNENGNENDNNLTLGEYLEKEVCKHGLETNYFKVDGENTGVCCSVISSQNKQSRSCLCCFGASEIYSVNHFNSFLSKLKETEYFFTEMAYFLVKEGKETFEKVWNHIENHNNNKKDNKLKNKKFMINLSSDFYIKQCFKEKYLQNIDLLVGNEKEFLQIAKQLKIKINENESQQKQLETIAQFVSSIENYPLKNGNKERIVIVTQGISPTIIGINGKTSIFEIDQKTLVSKENIQDTIGAGDCFSAGFFYGLIEDKNIKECVKLGHQLSSYIVTVEGVTFP